jgi:hypothetical protein
MSDHLVDSGVVVDRVFNDAVRRNDLDALINIKLDRTAEAGLPDTVATIVNGETTPEGHEPGVGLVNLRRHVRPQTLNRMLDVLAAQKTLSAEQQQAGYTLIQAVKVPQAFLDFMDENEARLKTFRREPPKNMALKNLEPFAQDYANAFADAYGMLDRPHVRVIKNPSVKNEGQTRVFEDGRCVLDVNVEKIYEYASRSSYALPRIVLNTGHEGFHAYAEAFTRGRVDMSRLNLAPAEHRTMMHVFNKAFFTSKDDAVYYAHPEENLAERAGIGVCAIAARQQRAAISKGYFQYQEGRYSDPLVTDKIVQVVAEANAHARAQRSIAMAAELRGRP